MLPTPLKSDAGRGGSAKHRVEMGGGTRLTDFEKLPTPTVKGEYNAQSASPKSGDGLATVAGSSIALREWMMGAPRDWSGLGETTQTSFITSENAKPPSETE